MESLETFFAILLGIQFFHSIEELSTGFHRQFPLGAMKFSTFLAFEVIFLGFWVVVFFMQALPYRELLMAFFNVLMFANGLWHMVWWGIEKRYVPGLVTAPLLVVTFLVFYFKVLF